jgi:hypothetical protein
MYFTYPIDEIDSGRNKDWGAHQDDEKKRRAEQLQKDPHPKKPVNVRDDWDDSVHGLKPVLDGLKSHHKTVFIPDKGGALIELLDKIGF